MHPNAVSIHIGINQLERSRYPAAAALRGCENDAVAMRRIAKAQGFDTRLLLGADATVAAVKDAVRQAAQAVGTGGILLLTYSGHGGFVPNLPGRVAGAGDAELAFNDADPENDDADETWCLSDRQVIDDELYRLWTLFPAGARILVVSDSCHSGTVIRGKKTQPRRSPAGTTRLRGGARNAARRKALTHAQAMAEYRRHRKEYESLRSALRREELPDVQASVLLFAATQDSATASDGPEHGAFTQALLEVWAGGAFQGSYLDFHASIFRKLRGIQTPGYAKTGVPNPAFEAQRPFTIDPPDAATMPQK